MATLEQVQQAIRENKTIGQVLEELRIENEQLEKERIEKEFYDSVLFNLGISQY